MDGLQLLDLPPAWQGSIVLALKPDSQLTGLFRTCRQLQQLLFSQSALRPTLLVHPNRIETLGGRLHSKALAMAEAAKTKLHLRTEFTYKRLLRYIKTVMEVQGQRQVTGATSSDTKPDNVQRPDYNYKQLITDGDYGVYELAGPANKNEAKVDIVFFHGLQLDAKEAWWATWQSRGETPELWPQAWLPEDLNKEYGIQARVLSMCYKANAVKGRSEDVIMETLAHDLYQWLTDEDVDVGGSASGETRRIVLVGHSFGGLIIKQLVLEANEAARISQTEVERAAARNFMTALSGFVFYATPHVGSPAANYYQRPWVKWLVSPSQLMTDWLTVYSQYGLDLNKSFIEVCNDRGLEKLMCVAEKQKTQAVPGFSLLLVPPESATLPGTDPYIVDADHHGVCKPLSQQAEDYKGLRKCFEEVVLPKISQHSAQRS